MSYWLTVKQMSERHGIPEPTLRYWVDLGLITSSKIRSQQFLDNESLMSYLDAHKRAGVSEGYLSQIIEEKRLEKEYVLSKYEDELYVLKTQALCAPLFKIILRELAQLIPHSEHRALFYAISMGEPIDRIAERHHMTYDKAVKLYSTLVEGLNDCRNEPIEDKKQIEESLTEPQPQVKIPLIPLVKLVNTRTRNVLRAYDISTIGQLLQYVQKHSWEDVQNMAGMGEISYTQLIEKLHELKIITQIPE